MQTANFKLQNQRETRNFDFCILHFSFCNGPVVLALLLILWFMPSALPAQPVDLEEQVRRIAAELRCPVCQNLSASDSPSELAQQMRAIILQQLKEGKSPDQIKAYFVSKYGEWVLLAPTAKGLGLLIWVLPFVALIAGIAFALFIVRRWSMKSDRPLISTVEPALIERVKREAALVAPLSEDLEAGTARSSLLQEQARLYAELRELEFDYQAARLSGGDYEDLRHKLETEAALVLKQLELSPPGPPGTAPQAAGKRPAAAQSKGVEVRKASRSAWQLATGGIFLLLFGVTLGVLLTKSLRPRGSEQDTITGDFLTGTGPGGIGTSSGIAGVEMGASSSKDLASLLAQGRAAYERQEWPKAIEAFKKALAIDANQPEAHAYMGLILAQAGHADGALMAFDRALSADAKFPLALWGKGMLLYRAKNDFSGASETLERLSSIMPPGAEKDELKKTIAEISKLSSQQKQVSKKSQSVTPQGPVQQIRGTISVDPKLSSKLHGQAVLYIIVYSAGSTTGPPLAVKKIEHPVFPLPYTVGPENVMMPGLSLSGKVQVSARLDKDGNPMTKEPGNLTGEYKKNPVPVGSQNIDIVIDQIM